MLFLLMLQILAAALTESHKKSSEAGSPLKLKIFIAGRNRLENCGATALAQAFQVPVAIHGGVGGACSKKVAALFILLGRIRHHRDAETTRGNTITYNSAQQ